MGYERSGGLDMISTGGKGRRGEVAQRVLSTVVFRLIISLLIIAALSSLRLFSDLLNTSSSTLTGEICVAYLGRWLASEGFPRHLLLEQSVISLDALAINGKAPNIQK